jgi:tetratricopeptide (TPR) repeat protein
VIPLDDLTASPSPEITELVGQYMQATDTDARNEMFERALAIDPVNAIRTFMVIVMSLASVRGSTEGESEALVEFGMLAYQAGDREGALSMWTHAATSGNTEAMRNLAILATQEGDPLESRRRWEQAADAGDGRAMYVLFEIDHTEGRTEAAQRWLEKSAAAGDPEGMAALGEGLMSDGRVVEGLAMLETAARAGVPWSLASVTWHYLKEGEYAHAMSFFEEAEAAAQIFVEQSGQDPQTGNPIAQLVNARSNVALCRLALGGDAAEAVRVWTAGAPTGHHESLFYPLVVQWVSGERDQAIAGYRALPDATKNDIPDTLGELSELGSWPGQWAMHGVALLDAARQ